MERPMRISQTTGQHGAVNVERPKRRGRDAVKLEAFAYGAE